MFESNRMSTEPKHIEAEATPPVAETKPASTRSLVIMTLAFALMIGLVVAAGPIRKMIMG